MIRRNFSLVLQDEGHYIFENDPLVTVTSVRMSPDLGLAKIYLSVYNTENKQAVILSMDEEKNRLKQSLGMRLRKQMRHIPDIDFYLDDTLDEMYRLNALFNQLHKEGQMGEEE
jgi:ribosome-binding factor A